MQIFFILTLLFFICGAIAYGGKPVFKNMLKNFKSKVLPTILVGLTIDQQLMAPAFATPLGEHTGCAYPACTSKIEVSLRHFIRFRSWYLQYLQDNHGLFLQILQSTAPGLVPEEVKKSQIQVLTDTQIWLNSFPEMLQNKVLILILI